MAPLIEFSSTKGIWLAADPIDMRQGVDGLSSKVQNALGRAPCDGSAFVFTNKRRNRIKLLIWDGNGVWLAMRRLHRGFFTWPTMADDTILVSQSQWQWLIAGVDWQRCQATPNAQWTV